MATATKPSVDEPTEEATRLGSATTAVSDAAGALVSAAGDAASKFPDVATTTRSAIEDANRRIQAGSDEMLTIGTALSFGFMVGLLIGGASRLLVAAALVPVAMMGLTILDRSSKTRAGTRVGL